MIFTFRTPLFSLTSRCLFVRKKIETFKMANKVVGATGALVGRSTARREFDSRTEKVFFRFWLFVYLFIPMILLYRP